MSGEPDPNPDTVHDEQSFLAFVEALAADRCIASEVAGGPYSAPRGWQNDSIDSFLRSAAAWAETSKFGEAQGLAGASLWRKFAVFLYCGKIYE
jgi:hypothetical protein